MCVCVCVLACMLLAWVRADFRVFFCLIFNLQMFNWDDVKCSACPSQLCCILIFNEISFKQKKKRDQRRLSAWQFDTFLRSQGVSFTCASFFWSLYLFLGEKIECRYVVVEGRWSTELVGRLFQQVFSLNLWRLSISCGSPSVWTSMCLQMI